ncbi:hypothetical protein CANCADRAFT_2503 [Tortispora caseinolytica NRRL Y-17796]|uniref:SDE2-like domain-containing protein n=1 Tax=Tortispora caseinolytica NRRL Y-17796 TaxID=767744 RepID=A0A1E4TGE8_9ASCO|nr:hypothetical protein CANCADRAFT_2503 [Tortispora caseinolytica NRRL Y-17796]
MAICILGVSNEEEAPINDIRRYLLNEEIDTRRFKMGDVWIRRVTEVNLDDEVLTIVRLDGSLSGGKGGFSVQLKAEGKRMRHKLEKIQGQSGRDLEGRSLRSIKRAEQLIEQLQSDSSSRESLQQRINALKDTLDQSGIDKVRATDDKWVNEHDLIIQEIIQVTENALGGVSEAPTASSEDGSHAELSTDMQIEAKHSRPSKRPQSLPGPKFSSFLETSDSDSEIS